MILPYLTGNYYPNLPRLKGGLGGKLSQMSKPNGMLRTLIEASECSMSHGGVSYFWAGPEPWLVFTRPKDLKNLVADGFEKNELTRRPSFDFFIQLFGDGLITAPKEEWFPRRTHAYKPAMLSRERLQAYLPVTQQIISDYLAYQFENHPKSKFGLMVEEFILINLIATFFGVSEFSPCHEVVRRTLPFLRKYLHEVFRFRNIAKFRTPMWLRRWVYRGEETDAYKIQRHMQETFLHDLGDMRDALFHREDNFVHHLREYLTQKDGVVPNDHVLAGEVIVMFFAGWDSTATTLHWTLRAIEAFPEVKTKLRAALAQSDDPLKCPYLTWVMNEAMRLYPPFPILTRGAEKPFVYDAIPFKRRTIAIFPLIAYHRDPATWGNDADLFNPDRFDPAVFTDTQRKAFKPFGVGMQSCIAMNFATQIMKLFIAHLYAHYDVSISGTTVELNQPFHTMTSTATLDMGGTTKPLDYADTWFHLSRGAGQFAHARDVSSSQV